MEVAYSMNNKKEKHALLKSCNVAARNKLFFHSRVISLCGESTEHRVSIGTTTFRYGIRILEIAFSIFFFFAIRVKMMKFSDDKET